MQLACCGRRLGNARKRPPGVCAKINWTESGEAESLPLQNKEVNPISEAERIPLPHWFSGRPSRFFDKRKGFRFPTGLAVDRVAFLTSGKDSASPLFGPHRWCWSSGIVSEYAIIHDMRALRYLTPLAKAGYIAAVDAENLHSPQRKYRLAAKGRRLVS